MMINKRILILGIVLIAVLAIATTVAQGQAMQHHLYCPVVAMTTTGMPPPTATPAPRPALKCVGRAYAVPPPTHTQDLRILVSVPLKMETEVVSYFDQFGRECDGLGFLGKWVEGTDWQDGIADLSTGIIFYDLPSLEHARQTVDEWKDSTDWFAYEITFMDRTPEDEQNDPAKASRLARKFARQNGMAYAVWPGRAMTRRHAAELAQYADVYGVAAHAERQESPETFIRLVQQTSQKIRVVNPDILLFVRVSTDQPEDDPEAIYDLITRLLGDIDGVFVRISSRQPDSLEKFETLVGLLREG